MKSTGVILLLFVVLAVLHQDEWNWDKDALVLGFMPIGLAYHVGYSIAVAIFWYLVVRFCWPSHLERWASGDGSGPKADQNRRDQR